MEFPSLGMRKATGFTAGLSVTMRFFPDNDPQRVRQVFTALLDLWQPLIRRSTEIALSMMIGNGEQILRWTGTIEDEFEWDHYLGHNNPEHAGYAFEPIPLRDFRPDWFRFTYGDLRNIIAICRETARDVCGLPLRVSALVEPGPEFSESLFRYVWHPEIVSYMGGGHGNSIDYKATLHADDRVYGAYPNGIPEGEPIARFIGKQVASYCQAMDVQAVSFSNGLGFGTHPWAIVGRNLDGERFGLADYQELAEDILSFWVEYKREAPNLPVSAQGSNWPVGVDLAAKGVPLRDLYDRRLLDTPLGYTVSVFFDDSVGFAMAALMSRIAHAPSWEISYYLHDPWYPQNPWEDFPYDRHPFDLYCPASICLINSEGQIVPPAGIGAGASHDEHGDICPETARSFIPHIETALHDLPDQIGPLTWLYPFQEYHEQMGQRPERASAIWFGDAFTARAIDAGLPLNGVVSTENLGAALRTGVLGDTVLYTPAPSAGAAYLPHLLSWIESGGKVLFYGPMDDAAPEVLGLLQLGLDDPVEGDLRLDWERGDGTSAQVQYGDRTLHHVGVTSGGGVREVLRSQSREVELVASVQRDGVVRTYALTARHRQLAWIRGTLPFDISGGERIVAHSLKQHINGARIPRVILGLLGWQIGHYLLTTEQRNPQLFISRHRNAFVVSGYKPDNTVEMSLRFPDGAPIFVGDDTLLQDGRALYHLDKSFHKTCRACVVQRSGLIGCRKTLNKEFTELEIAISGLQDARVTLYLPADKIEGATIRTRGGQSFDPQAQRVGDKVVLPNVTGSLLVRW